MKLFNRKKTPEQLEMEKKEKEKEDKLNKMFDADELICPYCNKEINHETGVITLHDDYFEASMIGCPHCKKVLGGRTHLH